MYTKQEAQKQRQAFWTTFGQYMQPILSADGEKINWINYKTGIQGIHFKMDADTEQASIAIVFSSHDSDIRRSYYDQLLLLKSALTEATGEHWEWQPDIQDEYGKEITKVGIVLDNVNILRKDDWPMIISFLKQRIVALDSFWCMAKYGFE
jgi:hypothetical protein